jgi:hypothetical protein
VNDSCFTACHTGLQNAINRTEQSALDLETLKNMVIDGRFRKQERTEGGSWRNSEESGFTEYFRMMNLLSQGLLLEQRGSENGGG